MPSMHSQLNEIHTNVDSLKNSSTAENTHIKYLNRMHLYIIYSILNSICKLRIKAQSKTKKIGIQRFLQFYVKIS